MYHSILVCQDASTHARRAFELAVWLATATQAQLHLIHLHSRKPHSRGRTSGSEMASIMQLRVEELGREGIRGDSRVVEGWTSQALVDESKWHDLVVVGRQGESHHGRTSGMGSLPGLLLATSPVPVLIVNDTPAIPDRIAVAFDGTPDACMALRIATSLTAERELGLHVVETMSRRRTEDHLPGARAYIDGWPDVEAAFVTLEGKAPDQFVSYVQAHDIQLVFASALDRSFLGRKLTTRIIEETDASLIVPRGRPLPVY